MKGLNSEAEASIAQACAAQDFGRAATCALQVYGPEILSFLVARLRTQSDGEEAFAMFAEDLWKGLPAFAFRCSARGYLYTLARNAANRYSVSPHQRKDRHQNVSGNASLSVMIDRARSATEAHRRTAVKDRIRALREQLPDDDQTLLILHVDRALPWREIAMVMAEEGEPLEGEALDRESARLRKQFERVKRQLKELAIKEGLLKS